MHSTSLLDGKALACTLKQQVRQKAAFLKNKGIQPTLAVVLIGDDPASQIYVASKRRQCQEVGISSQQINLCRNASFDEVSQVIHTLNQDQGVHGILIQLPLPVSLSTNAVLSLLDPDKDVDGLSFVNLGKLLTNDVSGLLPCTPQGILHLIKATGEDLKGKKAVVVGRSRLVGLPIAHLLLQENCTVTIAHSHSYDIPLLCQSADILIAACGQPQFIRGDWLKSGAIVIDVGIHRTPQGLVGDVKSTEAQGRAAYLTPVPGGVGPLTVTFLLSNTVLAASRQKKLLF